MLALVLVLMLVLAALIIILEYSCSRSISGSGSTDKIRQNTSSSITASLGGRVTVRSDTEAFTLAWSAQQGEQ